MHVRCGLPSFCQVGLPITEGYIFVYQISVFVASYLEGVSPAEKKKEKRKRKSEMGQPRLILIPKMKCGSGSALSLPQNERSK